MPLVDNKTLNSWERLKDSDIYFSFIKSPTAIVSSIILLIIFFCSFFVEFVTPHNPFDPASLSLMEAFTPPSWNEDGMAKFILGTDGQGRDMLSTILYGSRISLIVGFSAIIFSLILAGRTNSAYPNAGLQSELDAIAAVIIGGASFFGGRGTVLGVFAGVMIMGILRNGLNLMNVSVFWQQVLIGSIIILAVYIDVLRRQLATRT